MASPRLAKLRRQLLRWTCRLAALVALIYLCDYLLDAHMRITKAPSCEWYAVPRPDGDFYSARYCWLSKDTQLLHLYDQGGQLIAERTYPYSNVPQFIWGADFLQYDTWPEGSFIALPPSLIDRLRAKLP